MQHGLSRNGYDPEKTDPAYLDAGAYCAGVVESCRFFRGPCGNMRASNFAGNGPTILANLLLDRHDFI